MPSPAVGHGNFAGAVEEPTDLFEATDAEVTRLDGVKGPANQAGFLLLRSLPDTSETVARAELSTADVNDLPDAAFAHIEPGGKKDDEGKTTPRSKRHYPVHDKAHADNARARAEAAIKDGGDAAGIAKKALPKIKKAQAKFGEDVKREVEPQSEQETASALTACATQMASLVKQLEACRDHEQAEVLMGDADDMEDVDCLNDAIGALNYALTAVAAMAFHEAAEGDVERAGRRLSSKSLASVDAAITALQQLRDGAAAVIPPVITETDNMDPDIIETPAADAATEVERSEDAAVAIPDPEDSTVERSAEVEGEVARATEDSRSELQRALEDAVKAGVAPLQDELKRTRKALKRENEARAELERRLAVVEAQPMPGGPVSNAHAVQRGAAPVGEDGSQDIKEVIRKALAGIADPQKRAEAGVQIAAQLMPKYPVVTMPVVPPAE